MEFEKIPLKLGEPIYFTDKTKDYGMAEFTFCYKFRKGRIIKLFIAPRQQPEELGKLYIVSKLSCDSISFMSWTHEGYERPWPWMFGWCSLHQCPFAHVYVPPGTSRLTVKSLSTLQVIFE